MLGTRLQKWSLLLGCTISLFFFQNCAQNFDSAKNTSQAVPAGNALETPGGGSPTTPAPGNGKVNVFMATGHVGRTVFSCDDGRTWIRDRSDNDATRCWVDGDPNYVECDHTPNSGLGVDSGDGWFFANFGWGFNGSVRRSRDGVNWQVMVSDGNGGGIALLDGYLFVSWREGIVSPDLGVTWQNHPSSPKRNFAHPRIKRKGDTIAMIGRPTGMHKIGLSLDGGRSWSLPTALQNELWIKTFEKGAGRLVVVGYSDTTHVVSYSAISDNNGASWIIKEQTGISARWNELVYDGTKFVTFSAGLRWISTNGLDWTSAPITVAGMNAALLEGPMTFDPSTGTYVRILGVWGNFYDKQKAFRSTDGGLTWQMLSASAFKGGHPIRDITVGEMEAVYCQ